VLYIDSTGQCSWDNNHLELLQFMGLHLAVAVNNVTLQKQTAENRRLIATGNAALKLSHSVKNILQMIGGAVEVIDFGLRTNQIHRVKRSWDILKPNLARMKKYTLEMLDYSKERKLKLEPCDFNRVIQGAIESLKAQLKAKKSKLNIRIDRDMPTVELDSERIHEMALNLILNAIDIVDENTGIVSVETKYLADEQAISVDVTDNGPGITDDMKEKIFTPFESDKNKFGTGLGMPIAKQIVDQHGGRIDIETVKGKGTTFRIVMPAKLVGKNPQPD
jgi:signal transduction histidine kinase